MTKPPKVGLLSWQTLPYYLGGAIGPLGTLVVVSIYPELRQSFDASNSAVNWGYSGYFLPMAIFMLFSGTIGERYGRRRVTQIVYVTYAVATLAAALAPTLGLFIGARVVQGLCNAFFTPLMLAGLAEITEGAQLGRAMGIYSSFQAGGAALSPWAGGLMAVYNWRFAFVAIAVLAFLLAFRPPPGEPRLDASAPPIRPLLTKRMLVLWMAALTVSIGPIGINVLIGVASRDGLDAGSQTTGWILLVGGFSAMIFGPRWGAMLDRLGVPRYTTIACLVASGIVMLLGLATTVPRMFVGWTIGAAAVPMVVVALTHIAAVAVPSNRGGALSSVLAFRFLGLAVGPLIWIPLYADHPGLTFVIAGSLGLIALGLFAWVNRMPIPDEPAVAVPG